MILFRKLHKWFGLAIGLQIAIWMLSGLMMGLLENERVQGHNNQAHHAATPIGSGDRVLVDVDSVLAQFKSAGDIAGFRLQNFLDMTVYRVATSTGPLLIDASSGLQVQIDAIAARAVAMQDYAGEGVIAQIAELRAPSMEVRRYEGRVWRVDFEDADDTSIYVSAQDGSVLERRNSTWRLFDIFWMLHIMDYQNREDFNNALAIIFSLSAAWLSITGVLLLFDSFNKHDFLGLIPGTRWRQNATVTIRAPHGEVIARMQAVDGSQLYDELAKEKIVLPSNCGGGGTCGLCVVELDPAAPETAADRAQISAHKRESGVRLSCQARVRDGMAVGIPGDVLAAETIACTVTNTRLLTPYIREITLATGRDDFIYQAGSFVHVIIPPHEIRFDEAPTAGHIRKIWPACVDCNASHSGEEVRRAYSLATPGEENPGQLILNVRFMPPPDDSVTEAGIGSGFMWNITDGDALEVVGPFGDFHATDNNSDMIIIGGGAGMAPLRAIIRSELRRPTSNRLIDFWYGARSEDELFYVDEFEELARRHSRFRWHPVLSGSEMNAAWQGLTGFVHDSVREDVLNTVERYRDFEYYICGPPLMLAATRKMLVEYGVSPTQVFFDDFGI